MARDVMRWAAGVLAACVVLAAVYLPPRGGVREPRRTFLQVSRPTPARLRAQALAEQWRPVDAAVRLAEYRARLEPLLTHEGPALLVTGLDSVPASGRATLRAALDTAWRQLGLGATKVAVGVVVELREEGPAATAGAPTPGGSGTAYLLPDSSDRTTCVVSIAAGAYWTRTLLGRPSGGQPAPGQDQDPRRVSWLKGSLGPCAFYAAYGTPGRPVRRWLANRRFELAQAPAWADSGRPSTWGMSDATGGRWWWGWVYHQRATAVGCLGGRADACRAAVLEGAVPAGVGADDSVPRIATLDRWWWRRQQLVGGERFLADVAREVGRERFLRFWSSPLPVDTALAGALKMPVGEWTVRWQRRFGPRLPLGAASPVSAALLAVVLAGGAIATVALTAARRQVR